MNNEDAANNVKISDREKEFLKYTVTEPAIKKLRIKCAAARERWKATEISFVIN
jgi:hypothetical protein